MNGAVLSYDGINIADKVARTARNVKFDTYYSVNTIGDLGSSGCWLFSGIILAARTGYDYRRMGRNEITEGEFYHNMRTNTAGTVGSVIGCTIGIAIGVPIGQYIYNSIGAVIGAVSFGLTGGIIGESTGISLEN